MAAAGSQIQEEFPEKQLRRQLAATLRNIQWSYAVFWSLSARQQGVLSWGDGYYNGDIKTRKTTQPMEFKADQIGLQRSEQLSELYKSLSGGDDNQLTKRPSASLSPEDLTAAEWYYLVCMSFTFTPGQGLPGRALASNQHIWLSNAQFADSKTFSRSLLAKSASIQTVVCFPFMGGVLELGTTELILEDPSLIQQVTTSFWELPTLVYSEQSISSPPVAENDEDNDPPVHVQEVEDTMDLGKHNLVDTPLEESPTSFPFTLPSNVCNGETNLIHDLVEELNSNICEELRVQSPDNSSNECFPLNQNDDSFRMEGLNATSQVQNRQLMDDEFSNCVHASLNSSDCISQSFVYPQRILSSPKGERIKNNELDYLQEGNYAKLTSLDLDGDETHYTKTLSAILRNSKGLTSMPCFLNDSRESSFTIWRKGLSTVKPLSGTSQKILKKLLVDAVWINGGRSAEPPEENGTRDKVCKSEGDDAGVNHVLSERRRREKLNEKFLVLRSLVPSISKVDKASILGDTIEYLKELERKVEELESCKEIVELEARGRRKQPDIAERTSDNYGNNEDTNARRTTANKRKASDIEETEVEENHWVLSKDGIVDINITMVEKEVMIEMQCTWRDGLLLEIVDAIRNLHLDAHSVQSSTVDGILALTMKAKFRGLVIVSPRMIKRALQRVVGKC